MAHFAKIENGLVVQVIVLDNSCAENEKAGKEFLADNGFSGEWVQTSYNGNPVNGKDRGPFAGLGYTWDGTSFHAPDIPIIEGETT